nr:transposase (putative), gypsy type [Tanacetum cinerariifolium]
MADSWKAMDLNKFVVKDNMIDYVLHKYGSNWQVHDAIADGILDDSLKRDYDHNPFQVTSDENSDDTLKLSFEDTCSSDCTWEQKKASKEPGSRSTQTKKPFEGKKGSRSAKAKKLLFHQRLYSVDDNHDDNDDADDDDDDELLQQFQAEHNVYEFIPSFASIVTEIKYVLTQKGLKIFCETFHIPGDVHPQLPSPNQTIHEMHTGKIAAKVSHFEILCRVHGVEPTIGLLCCFYVNSKNKGWMSFSKRPDSDAVGIPVTVSRDPIPKSMEFRADDYTGLVARPDPFQKCPKPFLCLIGMSRNYTLDEDTYPTFLHNDGTEMDLFTFIQVADPTKVKVKERDTPARAESELEASVERLFDECGRADQGDSGTSGCQETKTRIAAGVRIVAEENVAAEKPKCPRKKRQAATDAGGSSHPPKKLRSDYGTSSGVVNAGKSPSAIKELLVSSILNVESGVEIVATLPFVNSFVSATLEHESGVPADSVTGPNLCPNGASERFISDSSHHSYTNAYGAEGDSIIRSLVVSPVMNEVVITTHLTSVPFALALKPNTKVITPVHACMFHDFDSTRTVRLDVAGLPMFPGRSFQWGLESLDASREFIDHLAPLVLFAQIRDMDYEELFTEFSVGTTHQACLSVEFRMRIEYFLSERRRLESEFEKQSDLLKAKDDEVESLKARLLLKEAEAAEAIRLRAEERNALGVNVTDLEASAVAKERALIDLNSLITSVKSQNDILVDRVTVYENCMEQLERFQDDQMKVVNDKFDQLYTNFVEMALHLEERFYPQLLTTISFRRWLLAQGMKLAIVKCMNSPEYLSALVAAISRAIEKGMQNGLSVGITHGKEGRVLIDVATHNPSTKADYISALQKLQNVNFSFLAELKSNKDASVKTVMNILRLEEPLAEKLGLNELQPTVDQLMVPNHHSPDKVGIGATALTLALDVSNIRVQKIRENIANQRSALRDVFVLLAEPFSTAALTGTKSTSDIVSAAANTTIALSRILASASTVPPITIEDYEVMGTDGPEDAPGSGQGKVASFPNIVEFEKEELDTTPEHITNKKVQAVPSPLPFLAWERCLHFVHIAFLEVADVPCSRKGVSVAVSKLVCSFAQCFRDFIWSFPLRSELAFILRIACFVASVDEPKTDPNRTVHTPKLPISTGISASVPYVSENGVSPLLDLVIVRPLACGCFTEAMHWQIRSFSYQSLNGLSMNCFSLLDIISPGTCLMENSLKVLARFLTFSRPAIKASYSASLLGASNLNLRACVNSIPFVFVIIRPAPERSMHDDPSVNSIHGSGVNVMFFQLKALFEKSSYDFRVRQYLLYGLVRDYNDCVCLEIPFQPTALTASFAAARVLKNDNDVSADLDRNLLRLPRFPFSFCTSFKHFGDGKLRTASTLSGHTFNPSAFTLYPRNVPFLIPKHLKGYPQKDSTFQSISSSGHPSRIFSMCSAMCCGTPVIFDGFQAMMSRLRLSRLHSSFRPSSVKVEHIAIVCSGYSGWIATWICSYVTWFITGRVIPGPETIVHSNGIILLLRNVTVPPATGNFSIPDICPGGHIISPLNSTSGVVAGTNWLLTSGQNLLKQCSCKISEEEHSSMYMWCTKCPPISASMIMGPSVLSSYPKGRKEITDSGVKV